MLAMSLLVGSSDGAADVEALRLMDVLADGAVAFMGAMDDVLASGPEMVFETGNFCGLDVGEG